MGLGYGVDSSKSNSEHVTVVKPRSGFESFRLGDVWEYRELLFLLARRDVSSRYKQTAIGVAWAVFQPVMTMIVFSTVFGALGKMPSDGKPYPVFTFTAMIPWQCFSSATSNCASSLWGTNAPLLSKVYFPRLVLPLSSVLPPLLDFAIAFVVLLVLMLMYGIIPGWKVVFLPFYLAMGIGLALGLGLWWTALGAEYRDIRHALPVFLQVLLYASPIAYSTTMIPVQWRLLYAVNPMVSVIEGFRECLLGTQVLTNDMILVSAVTTILTLISGAFVFRQLERKLADVI